MKRILALDLATRTGWAVAYDTFGTWDLKTRADESWGMKLIRFQAKLQEVINTYKINLIAYERPAGRNKHAIITQSKIIGIVEKLCEEQNIAYFALSAGEIKREITGKGNANKEKMIIAINTMFNLEVEDDNEADAIGIFHIANSRYNIPK